jgi:putative oxidoreductase
VAEEANRFGLKSARDSTTVARMAALQFLSKYRETGLLLIRASIGLIFIILIAPVLWNGQGSWEHFGSAMRHLDFHSHFKFWGFVGAVLGCAGGVLMILGLFFRVGVLLDLIITVVHLVVLWDMRTDFGTRLPALEMAIVLLSLLFIGPGKYSVDKN